MAYLIRMQVWVDVILWAQKLETQVQPGSLPLDLRAQQQSSHANPTSHSMLDILSMAQTDTQPKLQHSIFRLAEQRSLPKFKRRGMQKGHEGVQLGFSDEAGCALHYCSV